jgi:hypothetical protein
MHTALRPRRTQARDKKRDKKQCNATLHLLPRAKEVLTLTGKTESAPLLDYWPASLFFPGSSLFSLSLSPAWPCFVLFSNKGQDRGVLRRGEGQGTGVWRYMAAREEQHTVN